MTRLAFVKGLLMRTAKSAPGLSSVFLVNILVVAVLALPAWAYVNGGDFHSTLRTYEKSLKAEGWSVSFGAPLPPQFDRTQEVAEGVKVAPPDNPEYQRFVNQLVGQALQSLPKEGGSKIPVEAKREIARLTREALQDAISNKQQRSKKGAVGSLQYQVGAYAFESYWETNYGGKREIHARRSGLAPFVALKVVAAKD